MSKDPQEGWGWNVAKKTAYQKEHHRKERSLYQFGVEEGLDTGLGNQIETNTAHGMSLNYALYFLHKYFFF